MKDAPCVEKCGEGLPSFGGGEGPHVQMQKGFHASCCRPACRRGEGRGWPPFGLLSTYTYGGPRVLSMLRGDQVRGGLLAEKADWVAERFCLESSRGWGLLRGLRCLHVFTEVRRQWSWVRTLREGSYPVSSRR